MRKGTFRGNIIVWILVFFMFTGSSFLEGLSTVTAEVEYDSNMRTENYQVEVVLNEDNSYLITETIQVDMRRPRHGIYRYIAQKGYSEAFDTDGGLQRIPYYADVEVTRANTVVTTENSDGFFVMRLGSESETVYGEQTYFLQYRFIPRFQEKDFTCAFYNLLPMTWQNEIPAGSSFTFHFPKDFQHEKVNLYYGKYGSTEDASRILDLSWEGNTLKGRLNENLEFLSGVSLFADMGEGYFTETHQIPRIDMFSAIVAVLILGLMLVLYFLFGRDEQIIPSVQYQPPEGLDSAAVGYIVDGSIEDKDILSLILYWADKGYLTIEEPEKEKLYFQKTEMPFPEDAPLHESILFRRLFKSGEQVSVEKLKYHCADTIAACKVKLKDFVNGKGGIYTPQSRTARVAGTLLGVVPMALFVAMLAAFSKLTVMRTVFYMADVVLLLVGSFIFNSVVDNWYARTRGQRIRMGLLGLGMAMVSIGTLTGSYLMQLYQGEVFRFVPALIAVAVSSAVSVVLSGFMKKRTPQCIDRMGRLAGLRDFIETAELDRLKALAEENPQWFYHILPYTYVFGLSEIFAEKLEGLALPAPQWYTGYDKGYGMWNYYYFHRSFMMGSMRTMSQSLTLSKPVEVSGFDSKGGHGGGFGGGGFGGGGGFSGGGFGGGGGGSW